MGYPITFVPEGRLVYAPHRNVPGVIGRVTTIMGEYNVNISRMVTSSGVIDASEESIMILGIDNDVPRAAIDKCLETSDIHEMKIVNL